MPDEPQIVPHEEKQEDNQLTGANEPDTKALISKHGTKIGNDDPQKTSDASTQEESRSFAEKQKAVEDELDSFDFKEMLRYKYLDYEAEYERKHGDVYSDDAYHAMREIAFAKAEERSVQDHHLAVDMLARAEALSAKNLKAHLAALRDERTVSSNIRLITHTPVLIDGLVVALAQENHLSLVRSLLSSSSKEIEILDDRVDELVTDSAEAKLIKNRIRTVHIEKQNDLRNKLSEQGGSSDDQQLILDFAPNPDLSLEVNEETLEWLRGQKHKREIEREIEKKNNIPTEDEIANLPLYQRQTMRLKKMALHEPNSKSINNSQEKKALRAAAELITPQLAWAIERGDYDVIIGDDTHGRLPALLLHEITKRYAKDLPGAKNPPLYFVAGGEGIEKRRDAIKTHFRNLFQKSKPERILLVTETLQSGESELAFAKMMREIGVTVDVATTEVYADIGYGADSETKGAEYVELIKQKIKPAKLFYGYSSGDPSRLNSFAQGTIKKPENSENAIADVDRDRDFNRSRQIVNILMPAVVDELYDKYFRN